MKSKVWYPKVLMLGLAILLVMLLGGSVLAQSTISEARESVVRVAVFEAGADPYEDDELINIGTGFIIGEEAPFEYVATNLHLMEPWRFVPVLEDWGFAEELLERFEVDVYVYRSRDDLIPAEIHISLPKVDMALLEVDPDHLLYDYEPLELAHSGMVEIGDDVRAIGFPYAAGLEFPMPLGRVGLDDFPAAYPEDASISDGIISKELTIEGVGYYQTTASFNPGNSGGPLVNEDFQVIGVSTLTTGAEGIHAAFKIDYLREALQYRGIPFSTTDDEVVLPPVALSFTGIPSTAEVGEELNLMANLANQGEDAQDFHVSFYVDGDQVAMETVSELAPGESTEVSAPWTFGEAGEYSLEVSAAGETEEMAITAEATGVPLTYLLIGIGAAVLLIIVLLIVLLSRRRRPAAAMAQPFPSPAGQATAATGPSTRSRPEGPAPAATQARRQQTRPVVKGVSGHFAGQTLELSNNQLVIGRDPRLAQLVYPQDREEISRKHLTIRFDEQTQKFNLIDSSSNGTYLSSKQKLEPGQAYYLNSGERFYLADPKEVFEVNVE